jgi:Asp-tRNA(Asn)/Glu-tRNA(Gln) amidotransferase C subunit
MTADAHRAMKERLIWPFEKGLSELQNKISELKQQERTELNEAELSEVLNTIESMGRSIEKAGNIVQGMVKNTTKWLEGGNITPESSSNYEKSKNNMIEMATRTSNHFFEAAKFLEDFYNSPNPSLRSLESLTQKVDQTYTASKESTMLGHYRTN